jgi:hypothetical protein
MAAKTPALKDDVWELYHVDEDFSEANDLAAQNPQKLAELQAVFLKEAERNHVLPIDDRRVRALQPGHRRPPGPARRAQVADRVSRHGRDDGERVHQREGRAPHRSPPRWS